MKQLYSAIDKSLKENWRAIRFNIIMIKMESRNIMWAEAPDYLMNVG